MSTTRYRPTVSEVDGLTRYHWEPQGEAAPGVPGFDEAQGVSPDVVRLRGLEAPTDGGPVDTVELWQADGDAGSAFDGQVIQSWGPGQVPSEVDVTALVSDTAFLYGLRATGDGGSTDSQEHTGRTLPEGTHTVNAGDTLVLQVDEVDENGDPVAKVEGFLADIGKYEEGGEGRVDTRVELVNGGQVERTVLFEDVTLEVQEEEENFDYVAPLDSPEWHITALMPEGSNGQQAVVYGILAKAESGHYFVPAPAVLEVVGGDPGLSVAGNVDLSPGSAVLEVVGGTPVLEAEGAVSLTPGPAVLEVAGGTPGLAVEQDVELTPGGAVLEIGGVEPVVLVSTHGWFQSTKSYGGFFVSEETI